MEPPTTGTAAPLLAVVATTHPWPSAKLCLDSLIPQALQCGARIVLACSDGSGAPPDGYGVEVLIRPGASVFDLRAAGTGVCRAPLVAWTEDHCIPAPDWMAAILTAHASRPDAGAIVGPIENGSRESIADWANFLITFGPFAGGRSGAQTQRIPPAANISFPRAALPERPEPGEIEFAVLPQLWKEGRIAYRATAAVRHIQSFGAVLTPVVHFHNGRATAGMRVSSLTAPGRLGRVAFCAILPFEILRSSLAGVIGASGVPWARSLAYMMLLAVSHAAGELTGLLAGNAGRSPWLLE